MTRGKHKTYYEAQIERNRQEGLQYQQKIKTLRRFLEEQPELIQDHGKLERQIVQAQRELDKRTREIEELMQKIKAGNIQDRKPAFKSFNND
jgi:hypothetical protein